MSRILEQLVEKYNSEFGIDHYNRSTRDIRGAGDRLHKYKHRMSRRHYSNPLGEAEKADDDTNKYRYKILPKLFSNINEIMCSPNIRRKLINYYLRNRRRTKRISKGYSNQQSVDYMLHSLYMELGSTLYLYSKINEGKALKTIEEGRFNDASSLRVYGYSRNKSSQANMKRVKVWLINEESDRTVHEYFGQMVEAYIPARKESLGVCEATPEAVAELADVELEEAAEALAKPGELVLVGEIYKGDVSAPLYLMVEMLPDT
jgi:hypothetical protein